MSKVIFGKHATTFEGPDAVLLFKAVTLRTGLRMAQKGIKISHRIGPTRLLAAAEAFTGKKYKRRAYAIAIADLTQWIAAMEAALPIEKEK